MNRMSFRKSINDKHYLEFVSILNNSNFDIVNGNIPKPDFLKDKNNDGRLLSRVKGCLLGLAIGDAIGGPYEFEGREIRNANPARKMITGGSHNLLKGEWTDDTSMALCLAVSLICKGQSSLYDQLMRYNWWFTRGYLSSRNQCFDIGNITRHALSVFNIRKEQILVAMKYDRSDTNSDLLITDDVLNQYNFLFNCGSGYKGRKAGNGSLMRLAPIPLFFFGLKDEGLSAAEKSCLITHDDPEAVEACQLYTALIMGVLEGLDKEYILQSGFFEKYTGKRLKTENIKAIAEGSYKVNESINISGSGYVVHSLKAALWAFYNDEESFEKGVLLAINLGDDTDTTAAIYGQLAGAMYCIDGLPDEWRTALLHADSIVSIAEWLFVCNENIRQMRV